MVLIEHRINSLEALEKVPNGRGVEVDIRDYDGALRLTHDPLESGELFEDFLRAYRHSLLVVNVKCDGLEGQILNRLAQKGVKDFFFVDVAPPTLVRLAREGMRNLAVRLSEMENLAALEPFRGRAEWVWVDSFDGVPMDKPTYDSLRRDFKIAVVSPELHGFGREAIAPFRRASPGYVLDGVCSDFCEDWGTGLVLR